MSLMDGVRIDIGLNASPFSNGVRQAKSEVVTFEDTIKRVGRTIAGVFGVMGVGATMRQSLQAWNKQEWATKQLEIATARWAQGNKEVKTTIETLADEMQKLTGISDETWESVGAMGLNMGIAATKIRDATKAAGILNLVFGYDTNSMMRNLAKTTAGLTGELGEMLPFLRELSAEELKNGAAIDLVIEKYGDYAEMLSGTSKVATDRFKAALGDVTEMLGKRLAPIVGKAAEWMEDFSDSVEKNGSILGALKEKLRETWDNMGTLGKTVIGLAGSFLALKTAGMAWTLLSKVVTTGGTLIVGVFKTLFSWPALLAAGLYTLRVAWKKDWFSIRSTVLSAWESMKSGWSDAWDNLKEVWENPDLSFLDKTTASIGFIAGETVRGIVAGWVDTYSTFRDIWEDPDVSFWHKFTATISKTGKDTVSGLVSGWQEAYKSYEDIWNDENLSVVGKFATGLGQIARDMVDGLKVGWEDTHNTFVDLWKDENLSVVEKFSASVIKFGRDTWDGLKEGWTGSYETFSSIWASGNLSFWEKSMSSISAAVKKVWEGNNDAPGLLNVFSDAYNNFTAVWTNPDLSFWDKIWETLRQGPMVVFEAIQSVGASISALFGGDQQEFLDATNSALEGISAKLKEIKEADTIGKKIKIIVETVWGGITWIGEKIWNLDLVQMVRRDIEKALFGRSGTNAFGDTGSPSNPRLNINLGDVIVNAFGAIGNVIWSGLTWFAEGPLHSFANWVREQLGVSANNELEADLGSDLRVIVTGAFKGAKWLSDWLIEGLNWTSDQLNKVAAVMSKALSSVTLSEEEGALWGSIQSFGKAVGETISSGIRFSLSLTEVMKEAIEVAVTQIAGGSEALGMMAASAIPLYFAVKATGMDGFAQSITQTMILAGLVRGGGSGSLLMAGLAGGVWTLGITLAIGKIAQGIASGEIKQTVIDMMKAAGLGLLATSIAGPVVGGLVFTTTLYIEPIMGIIRQKWDEWLSKQDPIWQSVLGGPFYSLPDEAFEDPGEYIRKINEANRSFGGTGGFGDEPVQDTFAPLAEESFIEDTINKQFTATETLTNSIDELKKTIQDNTTDTHIEPPWGITASKSYLDSILKDYEAPDKAPWTIKQVLEAIPATSTVAEAIVGFASYESDFRPWARSSKGAQGIMQLMPDTVKDIERILQLPKYIEQFGTYAELFGDSIDPYDAKEGILAASVYLEWLQDTLQAFKEEHELGATTTRDLVGAYNAGIGTWQDVLLEVSEMPEETAKSIKKFSQAMMNYQEEIAKQAAVIEEAREKFKLGNLDLNFDIPTTYTPEYQSGGYTSNIGENQIAGVVHGGEWVAPKWMLDNPFYSSVIKALELSRKGYSSGISVISHLNEKIGGFQSGGYTVPKVGAELGPFPARTWQDYMKDVLDVMGEDFAWLTGLLTDMVEKIFPEFDAATDSLDALNKELQDLDMSAKDLDTELTVVQKSIRKFGETLSKASELFTYDEDTGELGTSEITSAFLNDASSLLAQLKAKIAGTAISPIDLGVQGEMTPMATTDFLVSFAMALGGAVLQLESLQKVLNPFSTLIGGILSVAEPVISGLAPLGGLIESLGYLIGSVLIPVLKPWIDQIGYASIVVTWFIDKFTLGIDTLFTWLDSLPIIGNWFNPILSEEQRQEKSKSLEERFQEYQEKTTPMQSTQGETFMAGSSQQITYNNSFDIHDNNMISPDSEIVRNLGDMIIENLRNRGMTIVVGEPT